MEHGNFVLVQKDRILQHGTLKDWTKFTTHNNGKKKRKHHEVQDIRSESREIKFFYRDNFVLP
jgi:oligoribonuclease (3'-5' exoribonuclease)